jgi:hypothetical protein
MSSPNVTSASSAQQPFNLTVATVQCLTGLQKDLDGGLKKSQANKNFLNCVQAAVQSEQTPGEESLSAAMTSATDGKDKPKRY